jgi:hypothetical protein
VDEARRDRQTGSGRNAYRSIEAEAGRQRQGDRQPNRGKQAGRQTEAGEDRGSQGKVGRQGSRDTHSEKGRYASNH